MYAPVFHRSCLHGSTARLLLVMWGIVLLAIAVPSSEAQPMFQPAVIAGQINASAINEVSGLAASRTTGSVLWTHNDSGDSARAFAINTDGQLLGTYRFSGAGAVDWEDMAVGPGPAAGQSYLYMGDIGDNSATRASGVRVYRALEPTVPTDPLAPVTVNLSGIESFTLKYPDGARDAETLLVDPLSGDLYIVSKRETYSRVYRAPASALINGATVTMEFKTTLPWGWTTGGDISPDGSEILIRGYFNASLWQRAAGADLWTAFSGPAISVPLAYEPQGESIGFDSNGGGYFTLSEGTNRPLYYYARIPEPTATALFAAAITYLLGRRPAKALARENARSRMN